MVAKMNIQPISMDNVTQAYFYMILNQPKNSLPTPNTAIWGWDAFYLELVTHFFWCSILSAGFEPSADLRQLIRPQTWMGRPG